MGEGRDEGVPARRLPVLLLLGAFLVLCAHGLRWDTPTVDEFAHLPAGIHYWKTGDFRLFALNPPLVKLVSALPALVLDPQVPTDAPVRHTGWFPWVYGTVFLERNRGIYDAVFLLGRLPVVLLGVALGLLVERWARELYGARAGLMALGLYAFCPSIVAHAHLATVDLGAAFFALLALYAFDRWLQEPTWGRLVLAGAALGLAQLSKFTALLLYPLIGVLALLAVWRHSVPGKEEGRPRGAGLWGAAGALALLAVVSVVVIDLGYLFQGVGTRLGEIGLESRSLGGLARALPALPSPLPAPYLLGLDGLQLINEQGEFPGYLFGAWSTEGWAVYYPVALLFKTPLPLLLALLAAPFARLLARRGAGASDGRALRARERAVWLPLLGLLAAFSLLSRVDYGIRYVLPVLPLGCIYAARWVPALSGSTGAPRRTSILRVAALVLLAVYPASALLATPDTISYFNLLAGGRGERILLDSNLDWGQGLKRLRAYMEKEGIEEIGLAYFGHVDPEVYGVRWHFPRPDRPELVAVSLNFLHGYPYATYAGGRIVPVPAGAFTWLAGHPRVAELGGGMVVVRVE